jgi:hypothetical protein
MLTPDLGYTVFNGLVPLKQQKEMLHGAAVTLKQHKHGVATGTYPISRRAGRHSVREC